MSATDNLASHEHKLTDLSSVARVVCSTTTAETVCSTSAIEASSHLPFPTSVLLTSTPPTSSSIKTSTSTRPRDIEATTANKMAVVLSINAMEDMHKTRGIAYNPNISKGPFAANKQQMYNTHARLPFRAKNSVDELTGGFSGMNLQGNGYAGSNARAAPQMSSHSSAIAPNMPFLYNGGHVGFNGNMYMPQHGLPFQAQPGNAPFYGYPQPNFGGEYSPNAWMPPSRVPSGDVPSLVAPRRDSSSSHENDLPGTPFSHYTGYGNGGVAIMDNSPNSVYAYSTPSPIQARFGGITKQPMPVMCPEHLQALALRKPAIPVAVPAPFSPQKPLEQRLVNKHGITSEYLFFR